MSTDKKLAHFVLQTRQLPALGDWYLRVLDTSDEEHHRLGIFQSLETVERAPLTVGLAHSTSGPRRVEAN